MDPAATLASTLRGNESAFDRDARQLVVFDWAARRIHVTTDGVTVRVLGSIHELLEELTVPCKLVAESTFESWDPQRRRRAIDALRSAGHELYVFRPKRTAKLRAELGIKKSDSADALVIHHLATRTRTHFYPAPDPSPDAVLRRQLANSAYLQVRANHEKPALAAKAADVLGPYSALDEPARAALGNGSAYSETLLAVLWFVALRVRSRDEFERLVGLHGSGYPSLLRSEIHTHVWRHARKRGVSWRTFRRELRRAFRVVRGHIEQSGIAAH